MSKAISPKAPRAQATHTLMKSFISIAVKIPFAIRIKIKALYPSVNLED